MNKETSITHRLGEVWNRLVQSAILLALTGISGLPVQTQAQDASEPPVVHIVSPIDGAVVVTPNDLLITVEADDPDGTVAQVALYRDGLFLAQAGASPYLFNLVNLTAGTHIYTAVATDNSGTTATSEPVTVFVEEPLPPYFPPSVSLTPATTNLVLTAPAEFSVTASATVYRDRLRYFIFQAVYEPFGSTPVELGEAVLNPSTLTLSNLAVGKYVFSVVVHDDHGQTATSSGIAVTVLPPPTEIPRFRFTDLGTLGGQYSRATGLNQRGEVVGTSRVALDSEEMRAYVWQAGVLREIPEAERQTFGNAINDSGLILGSLVRGGRLVGPFFWTPAAGLEALPIVGSQADGFGLNNLGQAVGWSGGPSELRPVVWDLSKGPGQSVQIAELSPGKYGQARAINDAGQIVGTVSAGPFATSHAVLWEKGQERDLRVTETFGAEHSYAYGLNEAGQVVGQVAIAPQDRRGFVWKEGTVNELMPLVGSAGGARAINNHGWIVGQSTPVRTFSVLGHATLWIDRVPFDLNTLVTNLGEAVLLSADAVNDQGQMVGTAFLDGQEHAYLLTPTTHVETHVRPNVELANPSPGATGIAGEPIVLLASASAAEGSVARVDFYAGNSVVASTYESPYAATWSPPEEGEVCLKAVVVDTAGYVASSEAICLTVLEAPARYQLADIGELAATGMWAGGLNAAGDFAGEARLESGSVGFIYRGGIITYLDTPGMQARPIDINDAGQVLVEQNLIAGIYFNGVITPLKSFSVFSPRSLGRAINNSGVVVGESRTDNGETHAAWFFDDDVTDLGLTFGLQSQANDINDAGVVTGWFHSAPGEPVWSFIRDPDGGIRQFGSALGGTSAQATGINQAGIVVGNASDDEGYQRAFVYEGGQMRSLGTLGGLNSYARAINSSNVIVGSSENQNFGRRAFIYSDGRMTDLNRLIPLSTVGVLTEAVAINDRGQILANGNPGPEDSNFRLFLLNPVPPAGQTNEPPAVSLQSPSGGAVYHEGDTVPLLASATDQDGSVSLVQFHAGPTSIGSVARQPFALAWSNVVAGTYQVTATAFDNLGGSRTSAPVTITIRSFDPAAPKVAIIGAAPAEHHADLRWNLRRAELFSSVDIIPPDPEKPWPTLAQLRAYDSVLVYSENTIGLPPGLGDVLADYLDSGHGVVLALQASDTAQPIVQGRFARDGYFAWTNEQISSHGNVSMMKDLPEHPILAGVDSFDGGFSAVYGHEMTLAPGSLVVASWATEHPLAVTREFGGGRLVGLNLYPVSQAASGLGWGTNSDGARLLGNSLTWSASGSASNRFVLETSSTNNNAYLPGQNVILTASGSNLPVGGTIQFFVNGSPLGTVANLPATFTWTNPPVGDHLIVAVHTDAAGRPITAPGVPIKVDSRLTVELLTPAHGTVVYLPTNILMQVALNDPDAPIARVDYYLDRTQRIGTVTEPPFAFNFTQFTVGTLNLSAMATDALGATRTTPIHQVTVVNTALPNVTEWTGTDGTWFTPTHWTKGPPRAQDTAVIDQGAVLVDSPSAVATNLTVGKDFAASLVQAGGSLDVGRILLLGDAPAAFGNYRLEAGSLSVEQFVLGRQGEGDAVQNGGSVVAEQIILGANRKEATGSYELTGGTLLVDHELIGGNGFGRFIQRGGTHAVLNTLQVGNRVESVGTFHLSGGSLITEFALIGSGGVNAESPSTFLQTGGTHQVRQELRVGANGAHGGLVISGGELQAARLHIGDGGLLDLVADSSAPRVRVTGTAQLEGRLSVRLPAGYEPLGGDTLTLLTYGSRQGTFVVTNLPPSSQGVIWSLEYRSQSLVLRALPPPNVVMVSPITANPQDGLFHQTVTLSNHGTEPLQGSRIYFPGLPPGWELYNAAGEEEGVPFVEVDSLVPPNSSIQFMVQFLIPGETRPARQNYVVRLGSVADAGAPTGPLQVEQTTRRTDDSIQLQFTSGRNRAYWIEYSEDLINWLTVPQPVVATGRQTQWVDDGPPKTTRRPGQESFRFYRIVELP